MNMKNTMIRNSVFLSGILLGVLLIFILIINFFSHNSCAKIIFVNKKDGNFSIENRKISSKKYSAEYIDYLVDDFLLGAVSPELKSFFTKNAKRKNSYMTNGDVYLDFNSLTFNECENVLKGLNILNRTIRINKKIKSFFLSADGTFYKYIGNYGSLINGIDNDSVFTENNIYIDN